MKTSVCLAVGHGLSVAVFRLVHCIKPSPLLPASIGLTSPLHSEQSSCHYAACALFSGLPTEHTHWEKTMQVPLLHAGSPAPVEHHAGPIYLPHPSFPLHMCRDMHITGGHAHDFVAIRISWIRGWCIRTPWCCEEVSSPGQHGVNCVNCILSPPTLPTATNWKRWGLATSSTKCMNLS